MTPKTWTCVWWGGGASCFAAICVLFGLLLSSPPPTPTPKLIAGRPAVTHNYAVSKLACERHMREFRVQADTVAKGQTTAESLEAVFEHLTATSLPAGYEARTKEDLLAHGCQ